MIHIKNYNAFKKLWFTSCYATTRAQSYNKCHTKWIGKVYEI